MLILKIRERGLYLEIPGLIPTRTPADIDITKCNLTLISAYLRKNGIKNYEIVSVSEDKHKETIMTSSTPDVKDSSINQKVLNQRFTRLEKLVQSLVEKEAGKDELNKEQITDKLETLELLARQLLSKKSSDTVITIGNENSTKKQKNISDDVEIEELDAPFIPSIDVSNMKMKSSSSSKKKIKQDKMDLDDSADLLSRLMGNED